MQHYPSDQVTTKKVLIAICLTSILLLTSLDSFGIDGVVPLIQNHFNVNGVETAMIQTASSAVHTGSFALMSIFGGLFERKNFFRNLYIVSVVFWISMSLLSIILGSESYIIFVIFRSLAAIGSAVFQVLSSVLMADIFSNRGLGVALTCMTACEMASGFTISAILSSLIVSGNYPWQTGLLPGPLLALIPLAGFACLMHKDTRHIISIKKSIIRDAFKIFTRKSLVFKTAAISIGAFYSSAYMFWIPAITLSAWTTYPSAFYGLSYPSVTVLSSFIGLAGNFIGMPIVLWIAQSWHDGTGVFKQRYSKAYPIVVSIGCLLNSIMFILDMLTINKNFIIRLISMFVSGFSVSAETCLVPLMTMMVLPKNSRAAAISLVRFISGIVTTPSAQLIGFLSDKIRGKSTLETDKFHSYQLAMLSFSVFLIAAVFLYWMAAIYFERDCKSAKVENSIERNGEEAEEWTSLIGSKGRTESLIESVIRSRANNIQQLSMMLILLVDKD